MDLNSKIIVLLGRVLNKDVDVRLDESLFDSGILDSFSLVDVVSAMEGEFGLTIPDSELNPRTFSTVTRMASYIRERRSPA
jgi:acyl carrier protein